VNLLYVPNVKCREHWPPPPLWNSDRNSWKWSFFDQNQQPRQSVEPFERILRALFISQCPYKFSSFLDLRNASDRFRLFSRDFRLFRFFFPGSVCFSTLVSPQNLPSWVKYYGRFESFGNEFRRTKFIAVERVRPLQFNVSGNLDIEAAELLFPDFCFHLIICTKNWRSNEDFSHRLLRPQKSVPGTYKPARRKL